MSKIRLPLCHHRRLGAAQGDERLDEAKLYKELGVLTKEKEKWEESIPYVSSLQDTVPTIVSFLDSPELLLRERAVNALGRIGRGDYSIIESYWASLFRFASDEEPKVRLAFIWASENIATNTPDIYENYMSVFEKLLHDVDDKVRMEAPEIFRVLGKRRPEFVRPYVEQLRHLSGIDENRVVRIHCLGAIRATGVK
jgi:HEAT repeat protein